LILKIVAKTKNKLIKYFRRGRKNMKTEISIVMSVCPSVSLCLHTKQICCHL